MLMRSDNAPKAEPGRHPEESIISVVLMSPKGHIAVVLKAPRMVAR